MSLPSWAPTLAQVAAYVPRRTIVGASTGYGDAKLTFDATTHPPDTVVTSLIADACNWVLAKTGPLDPGGSLDGFGAVVAAVATAAAVESGYPDNRDDLSNAQQLQARADAMRDDLWRANVAITGTDVEDPAAVLMPVFAFPDPDPWGDLDL